MQASTVSFLSELGPTPPLFKKWLFPRVHVYADFRFISIPIFLFYDWRGVIINYIAGYFRNPEATASALDSNAWLRTGDLCYIDDDGFLFVVDRLKEVIKYKGYQVIKNKQFCPSFFFLFFIPRKQVSECKLKYKK